MMRRKLWVDLFIAAMLAAQTTVALSDPLADALESFGAN